MVLHEYKPPKCFPNTSLTIRLSRPLIRTDTSLDRESRAFHCIHYQLSRHRETLHTTASVASCRDTETVHTTASVASCRDTERRCIPLHPLPAGETLHQPRIQTELSMGLHGSCQVSTLAPWDTMEAPCSVRATPTSLIRTDTTLPFTTYQNRPKLCWLEACREHHETRRDVVSSQTEGNSVRVAEDVLRVEGFSHKIVQVHQ